MNNGFSNLRIAFNRLFNGITPRRAAGTNANLEASEVEPNSTADYEQGNRERPDGTIEISSAPVENYDLLVHGLLTGGSTYPTTFSPAYNRVANDYGVDFHSQDLNIKASDIKTAFKNTFDYLKDSNQLQSAENINFSLRPKPAHVVASFIHQQSVPPKVYIINEEQAQGLVNQLSKTGNTEASAENINFNAVKVTLSQPDDKDKLAKKLEQVEIAYNQDTSNNKLDNQPAKFWLLLNDPDYLGKSRQIENGGSLDQAELTKTLALIPFYKGGWTEL